jgi:hypothetical protein
MIEPTAFVPMRGRFSGRHRNPECSGTAIIARMNSGYWASWEGRLPVLAGGSLLVRPGCCSDRLGVSAEFNSVSPLGVVGLPLSRVCCQSFRAIGKREFCSSWPLGQDGSMTTELDVIERGAGLVPTLIPNSFHRVSTDLALPQSWKYRMGGTAVIVGALARREQRGQLRACSAQTNQGKPHPLSVKP